MRLRPPLHFLALAAVALGAVTLPAAAARPKAAPPEKIISRVSPGVYHLGNRVPLEIEIPVSGAAFSLEGDLVAGSDWGPSARIAAVKALPPPSFPGKLTLKVEIQPFSTGNLVLPPLLASVRVSGQPRAFAVSIAPFAVAPLLPPGAPEPPDAAPVELPRPIPWFLLGGGAVVVTVALVVFVWWLRARRAKPAPARAQPSMRDTDPDAWIRQEVERLFGAPLEPPTKYAFLSQRVRDYLKLKTGLPFLEWTTGEVRGGLARIEGLPSVAAQDLMGVLALCDWAVFARYAPAAAEERDARAKALSFLDAARTPPPPKEARIQPPKGAKP